MRMDRTKMLWCLFLWLVTGTLHAQEPLVFVPHWSAQAQFAGYYAAEANGYYRDAGLNVQIKHARAGGTLFDRVRKGENMLLSLQLVTAMRLNDEGSHLVNILQYFQQNSQLIISHYPLRSAKDLNGMRVGHFRNGSSELLFALARRYRLNVEWVPFLSNTNLFVSGAIDATLAMSYNELFQLRIAGQRIKPDHMMRMSDMGYDVPEDGLYVNASYYKKRKDEIDKFAAATQKGWEWVATHPDDALELVLLYMRQNGVAANHILQRWMLNECINLLSEKESGRRTYRLSEKSVQLANRVLREGGIINHPITYQQLTRP